MPIPTDPLLANQWHLNQTVFGLFDLNVLGVWNPAEGPFYSGAGITTLVIDDGFDYNHQDFDNYDQNLDFDFTTSSLDPFGLATDAHGTAVAGIIGAAADGTGAVGVAFDTTLIGYRVEGLINDAWLVDITEAIAFGATNALADVINISQGIANDLNSEFGVGYTASRFDEIEASIQTAVNTGRGGLGTTIVKSAGNSRAGNFDVNADDWTNDTRQVVVAAVNQNGFVSDYSSYGAAVLVSAFGTPGEVFTTDRTGAAGYDAGDFTAGFNGTSSAAPMVTGVVALMYDANAGLGWRDVQSILAVSARHVGSLVGAGIAGSERYAWEWNGASTWNGGGAHFSNDYGYGLVDALAAVRLAETWLITGTAAAVTSSQFSNTMDVRDAPVVIPDGNATGLSFSGTAGFNDIVERVTVEMAFSTTFTGDMEVYLTSPSGTVSRLIDNAGDGNDFNGVWTFESQAFRGENSAGQWTVRVVDNAGGDVLTVTDIVIRTFGDFSADDRYIFTNEFSDYAGISGHLTSIVDTNFGTDTVNAAAVSSASTIQLDGGISTIDGIGVNFTDIEHAIGGDGGDALVGNIQSNQLFGMRGADNLFGGGNTDFLFGGTNNDTLDGGAGSDTLTGGTGNDIYVVDNIADVITEAFAEGVDRVLAFADYVLGAAANIEVLRAYLSAGTDPLKLTGNALAQSLIGNAGDNRLDGGAGAADTLIGSLGNDIYVIRTAGSLIVEGVGQGTADRAVVAVSFVLAGDDNIEVMQTTSVTGTTAINLTGNALAQRIFGNAGANRLEDGLGASDSLIGALGNDTYVVRNAGTLIVENAGGGTNDIVAASVSFVLAADDNIERMQTTSAAGLTPINLTGNALAQTIVGNSGANRIDGKGGSDTLTGGAGPDVFVFTSTLGATNIDRIVGYTAVADQIEIDNAVFTGMIDNNLALAASAFTANLTGLATLATQRIIYETDTGFLWFDQDGTGGVAARHFATVTIGTALAASEFTVI